MESQNKNQQQCFFREISYLNVLYTEVLIKLPLSFLFRLYKLEDFIRQRFSAIDWTGPWNLRNFEGLVNFLFFEIQCPEDLKWYLEVEKPKTGDSWVDEIRQYQLTRVCQNCVYYMQMFKYWSREEENSYLAVLVPEILQKKKNGRSVG
jgi:hypothetical protein